MHLKPPLQLFLLIAHVILLPVLVHGFFDVRGMLQKGFESSMKLLSLHKDGGELDKPNNVLKYDFELTYPIRVSDFFSCCSSFLAKLCCFLCEDQAV